MTAQQQRAAFPVCSAFYLQSKYLSFFSSQHVLLACCLAVPCLVSCRLPVSCLQSLGYPLQSTFCLPSHVFCLPLFCLLSTLPSLYSPVYSLPSTLIHSSFFHLPFPFSSAHLLLNGSVRCGYKCLRLCVVIFYLICNCTSYLPTPPHLCPAPPFFFHAKICNFIGLYRFAIAGEAKKESSVQKNYIAQSNSL